MIKSVLYFDFDCNFVCHYLVGSGRPLLKGIYGNALYENLQSFYNSKSLDGSEKIDERIMLFKNIPHTLIVIAGIEENKKFVSKMVNDQFVVYHQKNRLHYGTREIFSVVNSSIKELKKVDFMLDVFGPEEIPILFPEMFEKNNTADVSRYIRKCFERKYL